MNSFLTALNAVLPMFLMLSLGVIVRRIRLVDEHTLNQLNRLCFRAFLAVNVYYNICKVDIAEVFNARLQIYAVISQFVILAISVAVGLFFEKPKKRRGALAHGVFHTNFVIFETLIGTAL